MRSNKSDEGEFGDGRKDSVFAVEPSRLLFFFSSSSFIPLRSFYSTELMYSESCPWIISLATMCTQEREELSFPFAIHSLSKTLP